MRRDPFPQSDGTLNVSATGTRSVLEGTEAEVTYTYQPDMNDVLTRLAEVKPSSRPLPQTNRT